ncbi:thioesterase II family protein [Tahibacter soli]|jgi:medium-chain acyl-[acyl-carrier-protein] hydrolase|uniref:Alpha/beta fold hydrolase n=1 Tax=Tahibacter soli TaxID=2983605 RepID=A0A9X3YPL6_9GAMM|nr:alpha/beta fold hydrolase [Tahibacter soli]MDC8016147.1 alpha/beta fold hydrolase [Tahibacter soli]
MQSIHRQGRALRVIRRAPGARVRLFCFPYAGSGPSIFNDWPALMSDAVELVGVVYPGRECRAGEPLSRDLGELAQTLVDEIAERDDLPFAFFGHSMGAYVGFEVARRLAPRAQRPQHLFLSAAGAPHLPEPCRIHDLPSREFFKALVRLNGFPAEVLKETELVRYALPILRADFTACETYRFRADAPSRCPMTVFGGSHDIRVDRHRLEAWRQLASLSFSLRVFDGGHFYLRERKAELIGCMRPELARLGQGREVA